MWNLQPDLIISEPVLGNTLVLQYYENTQIFGYPIKYIQATEIANNKIFSESTARNFLNTKGFPMKSMRDEDNMYSGSEIFGGFGYAPSYSQILYIPVKYFNDLIIEPIEGDIIYDSIDNLLFQITKVDTKTESQSSIRINNLILARKIYLKQYQWSYLDKFDATLTTDIIDTALTLEDLANINLTLNTDITTLNVRDKTKVDNIFGDLE